MSASADIRHSRVLRSDVTDFPAARIIDPILAAAQRSKALPEAERRYPELPWATRSAVLLLDVARAACMSERRGGRQRAAGMIDLAKKELVEAVGVGKAIAREDLWNAMLAALGGDMTWCGIEAIGEMLSVHFHALPDHARPDTDGDDGDGAA